MHDFTALAIERDRRERLLEEARMNRMRKSLRGEGIRDSENKFKDFAKELKRDAEALIPPRHGTKERKRNV